MYTYIYMCTCIHISSTKSHYGGFQVDTQTHCNTLQRTASHCNILQHTATYCNRGGSILNAPHVSDPSGGYIYITQVYIRIYI